MGRVQLRTDVAIAAPPETVWEILTDLPRYADWNPMVVDASGSATREARLSLRYRSSVGLRLSFGVRVTRADAPRELRWLGRRLGVSGDHYFQLHRDGAGTRMVHGEDFRGALAGPLAFALRRQLPVFEAFNEALRRTAEDRAGTAPG